MRAMQLPKRWLIHDIGYQEFTGRDDWNEDQYAETVVIKNVRVELDTVFSRDSTQNKIVANGIIFVDSMHSKPTINFKEESLITFNQDTYKVKKVIPYYYPNKDEVRHIELEVI